MKTRDGFVSNSSSSSFLLAIQGELSKSQLLESLDLLPIGSPAALLIEPLLNYIVKHSKAAPQDSDEVKELMCDGWNVYTFDAWSDDCGDAGALFFYASEAEINTEDFKLLRW